MAAMTMADLRCGNTDLSTAPKMEMREWQRHSHEEAASRRFCSVSPIVAKPPPLTAAVLPRDRDNCFDTEKKKHQVAMTGVGHTVDDTLDGGNRGRGEPWRVADGRKKKEATATGDAATFGGDEHLLEKGSIFRVATIVKGGKNEVVSWRPWFPIVAQWQAQNHQSQESKHVLFEFVGQNQSAQAHETQQIWYTLIDRYYFKQWVPVVNFYFCISIEIR
ncbi:hypothetical protein PIB30_061091 [Stylosanthes scabra]|uniref:Uncharacterized protein n=1 Tax=Stylosanthes scabra TaxID=79078 RepID=A0ABU6TLF1_9FABA|nr:hypothetical protein [Stylosanthes scabra]